MASRGVTAGRHCLQPRAPYRLLAWCLPKGAVARSFARASHLKDSQLWYIAPPTCRICSSR
eukprot:scaffold200626_cov33-Tisochrysis_lutea.AAC.3